MKFIVSLCCVVSFIYCSEVLEFRNYHSSITNGTYLVSEKYDGIRAIWDGTTLKTKHGNPINAPQCFLEQLPTFTLDGELWLGYHTFDKIQSLVSRLDSSCDDWREVKYMIFDSPNEDCNATANHLHANNDVCTLLGRLERVKQFVATRQINTNLVVIEQIPFIKDDSNNFDKSLTSLLDEIVSKGGEGLIVRNNDEPYKKGRSESSFKLKPQNDAECEVIGYTEGKGRLRGKIGAIICKQDIVLDSDINKQDWEIFRHQCEKNSLPNEPCKVQITFKIGSGLNDDLRSNPPKIGEIITYKYNGFTQYGIPRHSVYLRKFEGY